MTESGRYIPEHLLYDILLWLPVESLLRFKCVCKHWCALIESSTFIAEHVHHSTNEEGIAAYSIQDVNYMSKTVKDIIMLIDGNEYNKCTKDYMKKLLPSQPFAQLVGSCDGILCLRITNVGNLALYNPVVKQLRHLPEPSFLTPPVGAESRYDIAGFGFESKTNDYKIVRILFCADNQSNDVHRFVIVEIYSKRTDSWRILYTKGTSLPFALIFHYPHTISKNGTCFWIGKDSDGGTCNLISFDLSDEVFGVMPLPDSHICDISCALDFLNDNLVYIKGVDLTTLYEQGHHFFEIWMLNEFGVKESWNKIYKIGPMPKFIRSSIREYYYPVRLSKNGESVILMRCRDFSNNGSAGQLHLFNLRTQDKKFPLIHPPNLWAYNVFNYQKSLVSVTS